ncbi:uncharacterized protein DUF4330 [Hydrogenispora ethanolica]|uniref:Uncharacterized protein DUF4330 n=2 Tax=Hydrogenispora ethanolica TaxID=1082276 RepID=A0A4R1RVK9_HYDET|nr:uncharacterized protein DUF4330 [Hydrogenispora ethanolica]
MQILVRLRVFPIKYFLGRSKLKGGETMSKLIDEHGKLFGLINPVDLFVLILVLALGIRLLSQYRPAPLELRKRPVAMGLLAQDLPPYVAQSIAVGQDLFQDGTNAYLGKVIRKTVQPAEILVQKDGQLLLVKAPRNVDLRLELRRQSGRVVTGPAHTGIYLGKLAVRVGNRLNCHTLYTRLRLEVESVRVNLR